MPGMRIEIDHDSAWFRTGGRVVGRYRFGDDHKPYLDELSTPAGHVLSLVSPHDHKHHKGLMYALRVPEVNFWEERSTLSGELVGRQRHDGFASVVDEGDEGDEGDEVSFVEDLTWLPRDGGEPLFREVRSIACRSDPEGGQTTWRWSTEITPLRDVELSMSQWSAQSASGALVNYHGLGLRLRRDFGCTGGNAVMLDGVEVPFAAAMGAAPAECAFHGSVDGTWPVQRAGVRMRQHQGNGLFVLQAPFAFLAMGPSNLGPLRLSAFETLAEWYEVDVFDLPPATPTV